MLVMFIYPEKEIEGHSTQVDFAVWGPKTNTWSRASTSVVCCLFQTLLVSCFIFIFLPFRCRQSMFSYNIQLWLEDGHCLYMLLLFCGNTQPATLCSPVSNFSWLFSRVSCDPLTSADHVLYRFVQDRLTLNKGQRTSFSLELPAINFFHFLPFSLFSTKHLILFHFKPEYKSIVMRCGWWRVEVLNGDE